MFLRPHRHEPAAPGERFIRKIPVSHDGKRYEFYSETLSKGGIYLRMLDPFPIGTMIGPTLLEGATLAAKGDVIYTKDLYGDYLDLPPGMAIKFKELTEAGPPRAEVVHGGPAGKGHIRKSGREDHREIETEPGGRPMKSSGILT